MHQEREDKTTPVILGQYKAENEEECLADTPTQTIEISSDFYLKIPQDASPFLEGTEGDSTGIVIWGASVCLAKYLYRRDIARAKTILELGSGAGLPSLVAAHKYKDVTVVATDMEEAALQQLKMEAELNQIQHNLIVEQFAWGTENANQIRERHKVNFLMASDVVYGNSMVDPLVETISALLPTEDGIAYLAFKTTRPGVQYFVRDAMPKAGFELIEVISCESYLKDQKTEDEAAISRWKGDHAIYVFQRRPSF